MILQAWSKVFFENCLYYFATKDIVVETNLYNVDVSMSENTDFNIPEWPLIVLRVIEYSWI